jgi:hypothetical protein
LHWARLAASTDPDNITIIALLDKKWYKNITPLLGPFPDIHVIAYFPPDTLIYEEPITPTPPITEPRIEIAVLYIYCVHHKNYPIHTHLNNHTFHQLLQQLNIQHTQHLFHSKSTTVKSGNPNIPINYYISTPYPPSSELPTAPPAQISTMLQLLY